MLCCGEGLGPMSARKHLKPDFPFLPKRHPTTMRLRVGIFHPDLDHVACGRAGGLACAARLATCSVCGETASQIVINRHHEKFPADSLTAAPLVTVRLPAMAAEGQRFSFVVGRNLKQRIAIVAAPVQLARALLCLTMDRMRKIGKSSIGRS
jgi:hypothetical protein